MLANLFETFEGEAIIQTLLPAVYARASSATGSQSDSLFLDILVYLCQCARNKIVPFNFYSSTIAVLCVKWGALVCPISTISLSLRRNNWTHAIYIMKPTQMNQINYDLVFFCSIAVLCVHAI